MSYSISSWRRKPNHPRHYVYVHDGRFLTGTVHQSRGLFSAISANGELIAVRNNLQAAIDSLIPATEASSSNSGLQSGEPESAAHCSRPATL